MSVSGPARRFDELTRIRKLGEKKRAHGERSSSLSLRTSCIAITGMRRTNTRYISANRPSEPHVMIQSHMVGTKRHHMLRAEPCDSVFHMIKMRSNHRPMLMPTEIAN